MSNIKFTEVNPDASGNRRYVCHFLNLAEGYPEALKIAHKIGGRKFHNKQYGGGIAFYGTPEQIEKQICQFSLKYRLDHKIDTKNTTHENDN